jgi:hypothetical protein
MLRPRAGAILRFACPACGAVFESGDRVPTRPYDLATLKAQLEEARAAAGLVTDRIWFVGVHGRSVGPLTSAGLEGLLARGQLHKGSLVWREGWPAWTAAEAVSELREILGLPPPTAPGEPPSLPESSA